MLVGADGRTITGAVPDTRVVEVVRSVAFKLNLGNYQSMDFFCSQKAQCPADEVDQVSADLYDWCYDEVMKAANEVKRKQALKNERTAA
jgi:hypothetical protein